MTFLIHFVGVYPSKYYHASGLTFYGRDHFFFHSCIAYIKHFDCQLTLLFNFILIDFYILLPLLLLLLLLLIIIMMVVMVTTKINNLNDFDYC